MKLNELKPSVPKLTKKRVGRGDKTAGKGNNGQNSRAGGGVKAYFEGGQMPIYRRIPKRGFSNVPFKKEYTLITLDTLNKFDEGTAVTPELLFESKTVKHMRDGIKVLGNGTLEKKISVKAHKISKSAKEAIEAKGGKVEIIEVKEFVRATREAASDNK